MKRYALSVLSIALCVFAAYAIPLAPRISYFGELISLYFEPSEDKGVDRSREKKRGKETESLTSQTTYFSQDFSSSSVVSSYVSSTPNSGQFNSISVTGEGMTISIDDGRLQFVRDGSSGFFTRSADFSPTPTTLKFSVDITVSGNVFSQTNAAIFQVGSGFSPTLNSAESTANTFARFGVNWTTVGGQFSIRNLENSSSSANFTGTRTLTWFLNNSGSAISYLAPDGTTESLSNDRADIWVGTSKALDDYMVTTPTQNMTDVKFAFTGGAGTIQLDNIVIEDIPPILPLADFVNLQFPSATSTTSGQPTEQIYGRIYEAGVTEAAGDSGSVTAELGYGPIGSDPRTSPSWTYFSASFNAQIGNDDEYVGTITAPTPPSTTQYAYTYRFSLDGGVNWTYADLNGNGTNPGLSFDPALLGTMTVNSAEPVIQVTGGPLNFGDQTVNTTSGSQSVTVTNVGTADLVLGTPLLASGTEFAVVGDPNGTVILPTESTTVSFSFTPASGGVKNDTVTISSNASGPAPTVSLTGNGIVSPEIEVAPASMTFGTQPVGSTSGTRSVTITNWGSGDLNLGALVKIGDHPNDFAITADPSNSTIAPGATAKVRVTFSPGDTGTRTAQILIPSDDADEPTINVVLTGTGTPAGTPPPVKSLWVWGGSPNPISDELGRALLVHRSRHQGITDLYVSVRNGSNQNSQGWEMYEVADVAALIAMAHAAGQKVWYTSGDPAWQSQPCDDSASSYRRMEEVIAYNAFVTPNERFDGVMLDVEPGASFDVSPYADLHQCLRTLLPESIKLGTAINSFWDDPVEYPAGGETKPEYQHVLDLSLDQVVVMGYRDTASGIIILDDDEIAYATSIGKAGLMIAGVETQEGAEAPNVTFFEEGQLAMEIETGLVAGNYASAIGFGGISIHAYQTAYLGGAPGWPAGPTAASVSISGRVITSSGSGIRGAVITLQGMDGVVRLGMTNTSGHYRIEGLTAGESYIVSVSARRYTFANGTQLLSVEDNISGLDFTASQ